MAHPSPRRRPQRYLTLYSRRVQFPAPAGSSEGPVLEFDIAGHPGCDFHFAVTFPYHSADGGSVTLIREYAQVRFRGRLEVGWGGLRLRARRMPRQPPGLHRNPAPAPANPRRASTR